MQYDTTPEYFNAWADELSRNPVVTLRNDELKISNPVSSVTYDLSTGEKVN